MDKTGESSLVTLILVVIFGFVCLGVFVWGYLVATKNLNDSWQREAVLQNKAEWVTDEKGKPAWQWKAQEPQP